MKPNALRIPRVRIQTEDFDASTEIAALHAQDGRVGAVCSFIGVVRSKHAVSGALHGALPSAADDISAMELEHYPGMTERSIEAMIDAAHARFDIIGARVVHRVGLLQALDQIVMVAVSSAHRGQSYQACEFLMDYLKTQAPFWKKEQTTAGAHWVDARESDDSAMRKWGLVSGNAGASSNTSA